MNSMASPPASILLWMKDIRWRPEVEHITLQAKSIQRSASSPGRSPVLLMATNPKATNQSQLNKAVADNRLCDPARLKKSVDTAMYVSSQLEHAVRSVSRILKQLLTLKSTDLKGDPASSQYVILSGELGKHLKTMCDAADQYFRSPQSQNTTSISNGRNILLRIRQQITALSSYTSMVAHQNGRSIYAVTRQNEALDSISELHGQFLEQIVLMDCQMLVNRLATAANCDEYITSVAAISDFANRGNNVRRLFCQVNAVSSLLRSDIPCDITDTMRVTSLRCLANICCHSDSILTLMREGNYHKLIALIWINENSDAIRCETAGVLAQVFSHLQPSKQKSDAVAAAALLLLDNLIASLPPVIRALIYGVRNLKEEETLLVVGACLATLSFLHAVTPILEILCQQDCMSSLLLAWRNGHAQSLFTKNQIIGVVLGLSMQPFGQEYLMRQPSLSEFFIDVLTQCMPENLASPAENNVRNRVTRRSLMVLGGLLKHEKFRLTFLKAQGIIVYQTVLGNAKRNLMIDRPSLSYAA